MAGLDHEPVPASVPSSGSKLPVPGPETVAPPAPPRPTASDIAGTTPPVETDVETTLQQAVPLVSASPAADQTPCPPPVLFWERTARRSTTLRRAREVPPRYVQVLPAWVHSHREWAEARERCSPPLLSYDRFKRLMLAARDLLLGLGESLAPQSLGMQRFVGDSEAAKDRLTIALLVEGQEKVLCAVSASGDVHGRVEQLLAVATAQSARRQGCLRLVLDRLFVVLAEKGVQRICVGTTAENVDAGLAYQRIGFVAVPRPPLDCVYRQTANNVTLTWVRELDTTLALPRPPAVWKPAMYDNPPELPDSIRKKKAKREPTLAATGACGLASAACLAAPAGAG